jgi:ubiquinone/menaquinone biosynthesis C-methylase UbiE
LKTYYDRRALEYDEWYLGRGRFQGLDRPGWNKELHDLERAIAALPPARTLDVACGTGFLTRHLRGEIIGLDQSEAMLAVARTRLPTVGFVRGDALHLPFENGSFERVFTAHFYGHLQGTERSRLLAETRRVASELVVVDSAWRADVEAESVQERRLNDGSRWSVFKRYFAPAQLLAELGGGRVIHSGHWFVAVAA